MFDYRDMLPAGLFEESDGGSGVTVAVIDTGVPRTAGVFPCISDNFTVESPDDIDGHATFIGSILFGRGDIRGICPNARPCFVKALSGGIAKPWPISKAIDFAVDSGAKVINLSFGFPHESGCPDQVAKACARARERGAVVVAAAGNDGGSTTWPASLESVICVGSGGSEGREVFSCHGDVDFVAPGVDLDVYSLDGSIEKRSGTSFSAPIVSGIAALIFARGLRSGRFMTPGEVEDELREMCTDVGDPGWDSDTGYGTFASLGTMKFEDSFLDTSTIRLIFDRIVSYVKSIIARR